MASSDLPALPVRELEALADSDPAEAVQRLRAALKSNPLCASAYRLLARSLRQTAELPPLSGPTSSNHQLASAAQALDRNDLEAAEKILRPHLLEWPEDANALRMIAHLALELGYEDEAEDLLRLTLDLQPESHAATLDLAFALRKKKLHPAAADLLDRAAQLRPDHRYTLYQRATELTRAGRHEDAAAQFQHLAALDPEDVKYLAGLADVLKTLGDSGQLIQLLRRGLEFAPTSGLLWWSLAELKTYRFDSNEIARMLEALGHDALPESDRLHIHFALGRAFESIGDPAAAIAHYHEGNRLRRAALPGDRGGIQDYVDNAATTFTRDFFRSREGSGAAEPGPIFIVGMTRAGSTLIEQIIASHPLVEGTMELPDVPYLAGRLYDNLPDYPAALASLPPSQFGQIGSDYLSRTRVYRTGGRPLFIDKMPSNWMHVPLIHLALPNARIIDARRHPLACCFSNYKQHFASGQSFSYDLGEMGRFYRAYVTFMAHLDRALPGRVHRVLHENMVENSERQIRALLDHIGLPFDSACLRFHENTRPVRTASAEQVRRPIDRAATEQWRPFEPWLDPLKAALGPVLDFYPDAPPDS